MKPRALILAALLGASLVPTAWAKRPAASRNITIKTTPQAQSGALEDDKTESADSLIRVTKTPRSKAGEPPALRAWNHFAAGDFAAAKHEYEHLLHTDPRNRDALLGLAHLAAHQQNFPLARGYLQRAVDADPRDADALAALATLSAAQDPTLAESQLKNLINNQPANAASRFALGVALARARRHAEARDFFQRALSLDPGHPDYQYNLAVSLDHQGARTDALAHYQAALELATRRRAAFDPAAVATRVDALTKAAPTTSPNTAKTSTTRP